MRYTRHVLYQNGDKQIPQAICDSNGDVVLGLCRVCGRGESELDQDQGICPGPKMPKWICHKVVEAAKIDSCNYDHSNDRWRLVLANGREVYMVDQLPSPVGVNPVGGYYVRYKDGYESWSPAKAFEEGYTGLNEEEREDPETRPISKELASELGISDVMPGSDEDPEQGEVTQLFSDAKTNGDFLMAASKRLVELGGYLNCALGGCLQELAKNHPCFSKAGVDEPIFTLRAKDRLSPKLIRTWAKRARRRGARKTKVKQAIELAKEMKDFDGRKYPT